jgi:beta-xylosidase
MLPISWTKDGWFKVTRNANAGDVLRKPSGGSNIKPDDLSYDFGADKLGLQWQAFKQFPAERIHLTGGQLLFDATGNSFENSVPLLVNAADKKYEIKVEYTIEDSATAGLTLFYNEQGNMRITVDKNQFTVYNQKSRKTGLKNEAGNHGFLKILNDESEVSFYFSANGKNWTRVERTIDATGFNHNIFNGFMSLRAGLFAFGKGKVIFDNFVYKKL